MLRGLLAGTVLVVLMAPAALAADKEVKGKLVKVERTKSLLTIETADGVKNYDVNDDTKFIGPRGGVSAKGINDERLVANVELKLLVAGNNRTLREVHIPEKSK